MVNGGGLYLRVIPIVLFGFVSRADLTIVLLIAQIGRLNGGRRS